MSLPIIHESLDDADVDQSGDKINRIENLMTELTRLMESLENPHNNITDNMVYNFSDSGQT